jgi:predicted CXXCH cytochrome family protein
MTLRDGFLICLLALALAGCSTPGKGVHPKLAEPSPAISGPRAANCIICHKQQYETWKATSHADVAAMATIPGVQRLECSACHDDLPAHVASPHESRPPDITAMSKSDQNRVCGRCHFSSDMPGRKGINLDHRHGLLTSVGFEGKKRQLSCLDCHKIHGGKGDMLRGMHAHTCFRCHKEAIVTMGVFQPLNYVAAGKICTACHATHGASTLGHAARMTVGVGATCIVCHIP